LITTIPTTLALHKFHQFVEFDFTRREDEDTGVKYIRPANIWNCCKIVVRIEQVRERSKGKNVRIQEDNLGIVCEAKDMQFGEDRVQVGAAWISVSAHMELSFFRAPAN
jgi:hypothetical protein